MSEAEPKPKTKDDADKARPKKADRDSAVATLKAERVKRIEDAVKTPPVPAPRSKQSLLEEGVANEAVAEKFLKDGNFDLATHHFQNATTCYQAAKIAPEEVVA